MFELDEQTLQRLTELDQLMAPLRAEAAEILERTRPGFRPYVAKPYAKIYAERAIGPDAFYQQQRERADATRRRNLEAKRLAEPPAPKPKNGKAPFRFRRWPSRKASVPQPSSTGGTVEW